MGGLACVFYGCRDPFEVDDLDLMLRPTIGNIKRFLSALASAGINAPAAASALARPGVQIPLKREFYLDVLTPPVSATFEGLCTHAQPAVMNGILVHVVGRDGLITLKRLVVQSLGEAVSKHHADLNRLEGV